MSADLDILSKTKIENHTEKLHDRLAKRYKSVGGFLGNIFSSKSGLSQQNAYLGLVFLNSMVDLRESENAYGTHRNYILQNTRRFRQMKTVSSPQKFWDKNRFPLLDDLFGKEMAPFVKEAWSMFPDLMYQTYYGRRSFRSSGLTDIFFARQLNFIIDLIHDYQYKLSFEQYIIHSNSIYSNALAYVIAGAIKLGDTKTKQLCLDAVYGGHAEAKPSRAIIKGLLLTEDPECWEAVEKLLLAAQRQEGLRQTVLEVLDETSLGAFKHMLHVIIDNKLSRFSSVVRAVDVWGGFGWEGEKEATISRFLDMAVKYLDNPEAIPAAMQSKDNSEIYMALWAQGVIDVAKTEPLLEGVLQGSREKQVLGLYFINQVGLSNYSIEFGQKMMSSDDPVILSMAVRLINHDSFIKTMNSKSKLELFRQLEPKLEVLPKKSVNSNPIVFNWLTVKYGQEFLFDLMVNLIDLSQEKNIEIILPYFEMLPLDVRESAVRKILKGYSAYSYEQSSNAKPLSNKQRDIALDLLKDRSDYIKRTAIHALKSAKLSPDELERVEPMLSRKAASFRKSMLELITKTGVKSVQKSAERLLVSKNLEQRLAGLDLLSWLKEQKGDAANWASAKAKEYNESRTLVSKEEVLLEGLLETTQKSVEFSKENGYGLFDPKALPKAGDLPKAAFSVYESAIKENPFGLSTSAGEVNKQLAKLGDIYLENKDYEYQREDWNGKMTSVLLGNEFSQIKRVEKDIPTEEKLNNYPLPEVWQQWYEDSKLTPRDLMLIHLHNERVRHDREKSVKSLETKWNKNTFFPEFPKLTKYEWQNPVAQIIAALSQRYPYAESIDFVLDYFQQMLSLVPSSQVRSYYVDESYWNNKVRTWREHPIIERTLRTLNGMKYSMNAEQFAHYWQLSQWYFLTLPGKAKEFQVNNLPGEYDYARALDEKLCTEDLLYWRFMETGALNRLTQKTPPNHYDLMKDYPYVQAYVDRCRNRILELELQRGDTSTPVSHLAVSVQNVYGTTNFVGLLKALGKDNLHRGYVYTFGNIDLDRKIILSSLLKVSQPTKEETQADFDALVKAAKIAEKRLCEAATYAPQWLPFVSNYLGWKEMESAVWWLHAHTNGFHNKQTESEISKHSQVAITEFKDGAVDIRWFKESYKALGKAKWKILYDAAKYISEGGGHKRALLYADVILGNTKITEVTARVKDKRNQDYLRVYGLIPLSRTNPEKDVLKRYQFLQNFKKESREFGSQRQASEGIAVKVALENLARTAGYPDPIRLTWAMETKEAQEILSKAGELNLENTIIKLEVNDQGKSAVVAERDGKKLKSIPAKWRKEKGVLKLKEFDKTLKAQYRRTRKSLEAAMINGDVFTRTEIETLATHPVVAPKLFKLVLVSEKNLGFWKAGQLASPEGEQFEPGEEIKLAHCFDLYASEKWSAFQKYCFEEKLVQPFKQIFRELYVPTKDELSEKTVSRRYAGHQVQPNKTVALLKGQGWT
ncbi:MAG: DUF4132 domain-containing protein, partial [Schleiferiaceae bacterium]|nr:DUF4132 domain-containing protein [Schleiferiaceae bacterium]